ncbi:MAG: ABC transporter permease, partial [Opitutales bacterium]
MKPNRHLWLWPVLTGALLLGLWYALRQIGGVSEWLLPMPDEIFRAAWTERGRLLPAAGSTALGALGGFALAAAAGFGLALLIGGFRTLRASLYPWLLVLQMTPVIVLTPLIVLWAGTGRPGIITVTFLISFFPIVVNMSQGLRSVDTNLVDLFRMSNATRLQELWLLRVPAAMPYFLAGLRIAATLAPIGAIFGEYLV